MHVTTLCITISLCATVALACLFSPKVYIILLHPEKNMRLTKQLQAQAHSLKFASQIGAKKNFMLNNQTLNHDLSISDVQSKLIISNDNNGEHSQSSASNLTVKFKTLVNNNEKTINNKQKLPTIVTTSQSESCLNNEKYKLKIKKYNYEDNDSLNSNPLQDEDIML